VVEEDNLGYIGKVRLFGRDARLYIASSSVASLSFGMSSVIFNLYLQEAHLTEDFIGFFLSISMFATAGIAFIAGSITDRMSRKRVILLANVVSFLALLIQYTFLDSTFLLLSQVFFGLSIAFTQVSWSPFITEISTDTERAHLFAFSSGLSMLAFLVGNLMGGYLPGIVSSVLGLGSSGSLLFPYRVVLWLSLIPNLVGILLIVPMTRDTPTYSEVRMSLSNVHNWGFIVKFAASVSVVGLGAGVIVLYFNLFFANEFSAGSDVVGLIFAINMVVLSAGNFLSPAIADRIGKVRTVVLTEALSIPFLLIIWWAPSIELAVLGFVMRSAMMNMSGPVSTAFFMEGLNKEERATAVGVVHTGDSFVRGVAANIGGWLLAAGFYRLPYLLVSGLYVVAVVLFYAFFRNKEEELEMLRRTEVVLKAPAEEAKDIT